MLAHWVKSYFPSVTVDLDVPLDLTVTASTDNTITLVWGVVQGPIDHYRVTYTSSSGITTEVTNNTLISKKIIFTILVQCIFLYFSLDIELLQGSE